MNWFSLLPTLIGLVMQIPAIKSVYDSAATNTMGKITAVLQGTSIVSELEAIGAELFPNLSPTVHAAAAALVIAHPNATSWLQSALNIVNGAKLKEDGIYGKRTRAAVEAFQTKMGFPVTGFAADLENAAIMAALAKL